MQTCRLQWGFQFEAQAKESGCVSLIINANDMLVSQDLQFAYPLQDRKEQTQNL